ncbi:MAG TPA: hypothetical protein VGK50_08205 [Coriobacteriia bacterium]|jgi:hypothetical protein
MIDRERTRSALASPAISALAAAVLFRLATSSFVTPPMVQDALAYTRSAQRLVARHLFAYSTAWPTAAHVAPNAIVTPGYLVFLAPFYALFGSAQSDATIRLVQPFVIGAQSLLAIATVFLVSLIGHRLGGRPSALLTGLLAAAYLPFGWAASVSLSESLGAFLVALDLLLALRFVEADVTRRTWRDAAVFGIASAALVMVRPVFALWPAAPFVYLVLRRLEPPRRLAVLAASALLGMALLIAPWTARNALVLHRLVPLRTSASAPLLDSLGGSRLAPDERSLWDRAMREQKDPAAAVAASRIRARLRSDASGFVLERVEWTLRAFSTPWIAVYDVFWEERFQRQTDRVDLSPDFSGAPTLALASLAGVSKYYHLGLSAMAAFGLLFVRRRPSVAVVASLPVYVLASMFTVLPQTRYAFPAAPALIVMASVGAAGVIPRVRVAVRARRVPVSSASEHGGSERTV